MPASRTAEIVSSRSSYDLVVITCTPCQPHALWTPCQTQTHRRVELSRGVKVVIVRSQTSKRGTPVKTL